ncbi:hypothetical protein DEO72_LG8g1974 [Vigna unguiculata]|uniref:Uncharacterized protein n=1 Tax=Vigna unguiculata TaxID=3917 RepID=A0A4D6MTI4_VIGUN|nr:hypothetical protein DEO72_LG8g1974 [Vigna unguiculata]
MKAAHCSGSANSRFCVLQLRWRFATMLCSCSCGGRWWRSGSSAAAAVQSQAKLVVTAVSISGKVSAA